MCQIPCPGIKSFHKQIRKKMLKIVFDTKPPLEVKVFLKSCLNFLYFCFLFFIREVKNISYVMDIFSCFLHMIKSTQIETFAIVSRFIHFKIKLHNLRIRWHCTERSSISMTSNDLRMISFLLGQGTAKIGHS